MTLAERARMAAEAVLPCWCIDAYINRNLTQPDCPGCNFAEDVADAMLNLAREHAEAAILEYNKLGIVSRGMTPEQRRNEALAAAESGPEPRTEDENGL